MKGRLNISVDEDISNDIEKRRVDSKFNVSEWFRTKYNDEFLNIDLKRQELKDLEEKAAELRKEIEQSDKLDKEINRQYTRDERRYLINTPIALKNGSNMKGLWQVFNKLFKRDVSLDEFVSAAKVLSNGKA